MNPRIISVCLALFPTIAGAENVVAGTMEISDPVVRSTPAGAMAGAGYLTLRNTGTETEHLLAVEAEFPRVQIHGMEMTDGVAQMTPMETVEIPPGESVTFEPGGLHVMFMGLGGDPFEVGEDVPATLIFETLGAVEVTFTVIDMSDH